MTLSFAPDAIETWPLARLQPYAKNANARGGSGRQDRRQHGGVRLDGALPVAEDGELIAGHGRVLAATQLGHLKVPVRCLLGDLTEARRRRNHGQVLGKSPWDEALQPAEAAGSWRPTISTCLWSASPTLNSTSCSPFAMQ